MCQPGRPRPQGEFQEVSSPSFFAFQSAKSRGSSLSGFGSCSSTWSGPVAGELPVVREARDAEVDVAVDLVGVPALDQLLDVLDDHRDVHRHLRQLVGHAEPESPRCPPGTRRSPAWRARRSSRRRGVVDLVVDVGDVVDERRRCSPSPSATTATTSRSRTAARCRRARARRRSARRCTSAPGRAASGRSTSAFVYVSKSSIDPP